MGKRGPIQRSDAPRVPAPRRARGGAAWPAAGCPDARPRVVTAGRGDPEVSLLTAQSRELLDPQFTVRQRWGKCSSAPPAPVCTRCSHGNFAESRMRPHCWTRTRAHTHAHARTHARTLTHAHTCSHVHTRAHTFTHARTDTLTHTCGRTCTHAHRHTLTHGRVRTRTQRCGRQRSRRAWARSIRAEGRPRPQAALGVTQAQARHRADRGFAHAPCAPLRPELPSDAWESGTPLGKPLALVPRSEAVLGAGETRVLAAVGCLLCV